MKSFYCHNIRGWSQNIRRWRQNIRWDVECFVDFIHNTMIFRNFSFQKFWPQQWCSIVVTRIGRSLLAQNQSKINLENQNKIGPAITKTRIPFDQTSKLYVCPTEDCNIQSKCRSNVLKHLKSCDSIRKKRKSIAYNKICPFCSKSFCAKI